MRPPAGFCSMCAASFRQRPRPPATRRRWPRRSARWTARPILNSSHGQLPYHPDHHPHGAYRQQPPMGGSWRLTSPPTPQPRDLLRQAGRLARAGLGGGMAYSNNAENIYSFRINRIEPLHIPLLSRLTGPFRYEFLVGGCAATPYAQSGESRPLPICPT